MTVINLNSDNFENEVLKSSVPVIVDFWAEWCGPCRLLSPVIEELAEDNKDTLKVAKLNVDDNSELARTYGVMSIPTIVYFENGQEVKRVVGAKDKVGFEQEFNLAAKGEAD